MTEIGIFTFIWTSLFLFVLASIREGVVDDRKHLQICRDAWANYYSRHREKSAFHADELVKSQYLSKLNHLQNKSSISLAEEIELKMLQGKYGYYLEREPLQKQIDSMVKTKSALHSSSYQIAMIDFSRYRRALAQDIELLSSILEILVDSGNHKDYRGRRDAFVRLGDLTDSLFSNAASELRVGLVARGYQKITALSRQATTQKNIDKIVGDCLSELPDGLQQRIGALYAPERWGRVQSDW